jgi:hypothetical protein
MSFFMARCECGDHFPMDLETTRDEIHDNPDLGKCGACVVAAEGPDA